MNLDLLRQQLIRHEGVRLRPYRDSVGKLTIGIGRNLDDVGISQDEAEILLDHDIQKVIQDLDTYLPWWKSLTDVRQMVLADMAFNLGITKLLGFTQTLASIKQGDFESAARHMSQSVWATQVGNRAVRLQEMMRTG